MSMIYLYGDSLLKATMPDESFRYHFHLDQLSSRYAGSPLTMVNRSKMGATVAKGQSLLAHDLQREMPAQMALIGYGGNDCDFCWQQIAENPDGEHHPHTELNTYLQALVRMAKDLLSRGIQPVLMTLPPIDARRYLDALDDRDEKWHFLMGEALFGLEDHAGAVQMYHLVEEAMPQAVRRKLQLCYAALKDFEKAYYYATMG